MQQHSCDPTQIGRQITQMVLNGPDAETVLQRIARTVGETFQADYCSIALLGTHQAPTSFWCADDSAPLAPDKLAQLLENPALASISVITEPLAITDIRTERTKSLVEGHLTELPVQAVLVMPTWFQSQQNGVIIMGRSQPKAWSDSEKELLLVVSEPVAIAITQVQLQQQVHTASKHQNAIQQLTMAIRSTFDVDQILNQAIASATTALQVDRGLILMLKYSDPLWKKDTLQRLPKAKATVVCEWPSIGSASGGTSQQPCDVPPEMPPSATSPPSQGGLGGIFRRGDLPHSHTLLNHSFWLSDSHWCQQAFTDAPGMVAIADIQSLPPNADSENQKTKCIFSASAMPALLMVPLLGALSEASVPSTVLGFLVLQHSEPRNWQPEELELVNWVCAQASTAIIQSQTLQQVQALVEERTAQLQSSLEVQAKLYEKTRQQIDQLRHLNQLKDEFLSTVSHELRTPLTNMSLAIRMLRQSELPSDRRAKYLDILEQQCTQEIKLINDLLTLQQLESNHFSVHLQKIDLLQVVQGLARSFEEKWRDKGLTLAVDLPERSLVLQTDSDSLNRILLELLANAGKYSPPDTTVHLRITQQLDRQGDRVDLAVSNIGSGITPPEQTYIFDKFRRGKGVTQQAIQGTGLGLALVKSLVEHLNGTIEVKSCPIENTQSWETCFTLTLPKFFDSSVDRYS